MDNYYNYSFTWDVPEDLRGTKELLDVEDAFYTYVEGTFGLAPEDAFSAQGVDSNGKASMRASMLFDGFVEFIVCFVNNKHVTNITAEDVLALENELKSAAVEDNTGIIFSINEDNEGVIDSTAICGVEVYALEEDFEINYWGYGSSHNDSLEYCEGFDSDIEW